MANKIILKKTSTAAKVPLATDLEVGEIAVNLADQKLYSKDASGTVIVVGQGIGGSGDVVGPTSATDNALARFDSTTGKLIQNSVVTVSDTGAIAGAESISNIDFAQFDTTVTPVEAVGKLQWDDGNGTLQVGLKGGNVNLQIGQEIVARVYNDSGVALTDGQIVYISGAQGNRIAVKLAKADTDATSAGTLGMVTESIAIGAEGFITVMGTVNKLNTTGLTAGAIVYLSPTTAGAYTTTKPVAPQHTVTLGYVERVDSVVGSIYVKVDNGYELDELHNVLITSPTSGQTLIYDAVQGVWENANISAGTGISVTNGAGSITVANTGVNSVNGVTGAVTATNLLDAIKTVDGAGSGLDADTLDGNSSAYFQQALVSGTNIKTVNGTTLLGSGNLAVGTVTSVGATVPTGLSVSGSPITGSGTLAITYTAGYSIPTDASQTNWNTAYSDRLKWDGGSTGLVAATGRTSLGGTTVGQNFFTLTNPTAVTFPRMNADNTVSALDAATFRTAIGAGTGNGSVTGVTGTAPIVSSGGTAPAISITQATTSTNGYLSSTDWNTFNNKTSNTGTVTSVSGTGTVSGLTLSGTVTTSGSLTLGGTFSSTISGISDAYRWWNNFGDNHSTRTSFDAQGAASSVNFGWRYVQGSTNGPGVNSAAQYYSQFVGLGNDYPYNLYGMQIAYPRNVSNPYISIRFEEGGAFGAWQKISAGYADTAGSATTATTLATGRTIAITGDLTYTSPSFNGSGNVTAAGTLATVNSNVGSFGSSTAIPVVTVNAKGLVTAVSTATVSGGQYFGTAATKAIAYNANTISENITVTAGNNGLSAGPITISTGFSVTVQTGANWVIV